MEKRARRRKTRKNSTLGKLNRLGTLKPDTRFCFRLPGQHADAYSRVLSFPRYWPAILVLAGLTVAFAIPLFQLPMDIGGAEDLFDLTSSLFMLFWAMGWSVGVLAMVSALLLLLFSREVVIVEPESIRLRLECFRFGMESRYSLSRLSNLRYQTESPDKGSKWRREHLVFDYLQVPVSFGSRLERTKAQQLMFDINRALTHSIPASLSASMLKTLKEQQDNPKTVAEPVAPAPVQVAERETAAQGSKLSLWILLAANVVPLAGVLLLNWNVGEIMLLFWLESAIVGFFNILKMFRIAGPVALFYSLFFVGHFGAFMAVHLMFVFSLFIEEQGATASLQEVALIFSNLWVAILVLFISHGFSFVENFLRKREYETTDIKTQMHKPYSRIITMHVTLIVGGFLILTLDAPILALSLLIILKMAADATAHVKEHKKA